MEITRIVDANSDDIEQLRLLSEQGIAISPEAALRVIYAYQQLLKEHEQVKNAYSTFKEATRRFFS